jgi:hypothetical protein
MSVPSQSVSVTDLDFDQIKENLIEYFKAQDSPFKDWDYFGSGLNTLFDVLAHNTHYNAMLAHMAVNESFIDTAQIRANVVSAAKLIGYTPNSYTASSATAHINASASSTTVANDEIVLIERGSSFSGNGGDGINYQFTNLDDIILYKESAISNIYSTEEPVKLYQGYIETKRIQINDRQANNQYIIEDKNIDINTLKVLVYTPNSNNAAEIYYPFTDVKNIDETSPIYFIYENYNGNYVISFGNNVFGKRPDNLNILELSYIVTDGLDANGIREFNYSGGGSGFTFQVEKVTNSSGGSYAESISSIKYNAPLNYISQNRAVTADDYEVLIKKSFTDADSISVWGGEENNPPQYGKVFISIKKKDTLSPLTSLEKNTIYDTLKTKKVLTILPEIVDAEYVNVVLDVLFKYNANLTKYSKVQLENFIKQQVSDFNDFHLNRFDGIFRHSFLSRTIDQSDPSILNSLVRVFVSKTFEINALDPKLITLNYGTPVTVDDDSAIAYSSPYVYKNTTLYIGDIPHPTDKNLRILNTYYYDVNSQEKQIFFDDIGQINLSAGIIELDALNSDDGITSIIIDLIPESNDIAPKRNQLVSIDTSRLTVYGEVDKIAIGGAARLGDYNTFKRDR